MPFNLVIILAPKLAYLNEKNEISVRRPNNPVQAVTNISNSELIADQNVPENIQTDIQTEKSNANMNSIGEGENEIVKKDKPIFKQVEMSTIDTSNLPDVNVASNSTIRKGTFVIKKTPTTDNTTGPTTTSSTTSTTSSSLLDTFRKTTNELSPLSINSQPSITSTDASGPKTNQASLSTIRRTSGTASSPYPALPVSESANQGASGLLSAFSNDGDQLALYKMESNTKQGSLKKKRSSKEGAIAPMPPTSQINPSEAVSNSLVSPFSNISSNKLPEAENISGKVLQPPSIVPHEPGLESIHGEAVNEITLLTEVNIRSFIMNEMDKLYQEGIICARPTLVDDESGNSLQAMCICEKESVDMIIARMAFYGVGNLVGSVNVLTLESSKFFRPKPSEDVKTQDLEIGMPSGRGRSGSINADNAQEEQKRIFREVASQIRVEQVVEQIEGSAFMNFDYLSLLLVASTIAGIGLATNNTVAIVASMLVSPIMGPVLALTFGTVINNWELTRLGLKSELLSLMICVIIGFIIGIISISVGTGGLWPTNEMKSRGLLNGLAVGFAIAVPSGMGVALSVLGNNTSSLVGVAISASLLPPAVNCGLAFAYAAIGFSLDKNSNSYTGTNYDTASSYLDLGGISLALTIVNIGAIYLSGLLMFRIKEVAPIENKTAFWERDTQAFRRLHQMQQHHHAPEDDIESQVNLLKEVGRNKELRRQIMENQELDLYSGHEPNLSNLLSATSTIGRRRQHSEDLPQSPKKNSLLELFRDAEDEQDQTHGGFSPVSPKRKHAKSMRFHGIVNNNGDHPESPNQNDLFPSSNHRNQYYFQSLPKSEIESPPRSASKHPIASNQRGVESKFDVKDIKERLRLQGKTLSINNREPKTKPY